MTQDAPKKITTREKILSAAKALFLEQGFNGTSMSDIARQANVNQSLIHHHFDNKEKLWGTIRDQLFDSYLASLEEQLRAAPTDTSAFIGNMMQLRFNFLKDNPEVSRMMEWQSVNMASDGSSGAMAGERSNERIHTLLSEAVNVFKKAHGSEDKNQAALTLMMVLILTSGWFQGNNQWMLKQMLGDEYDAQSLGEQYVSAIQKLITQGAL